MNEVAKQVFEDWISRPPFEREIEKHDETSAWPGAYKRINVALAWEAFKEGMKMKTTEVKLKRFIVCGGRDFHNWKFMMEKLDVLLQSDWNFVLVHGAARGADEYAAGWGEWRKVIVEAHPADWERYGKKAGMMRNWEMLQTGVDGVVAFTGGVGTAGMVAIAQQAGVPVWDLRGQG